MKKITILCVLLMFMLSGCSAKKETLSKEETETKTEEIPESVRQDIGSICGTWKVCGVSYDGVRFTMEQIRAFTDEFPDMIAVFTKDGSVFSASAYETEIMEASWEKGEEENTVMIGDAVLYLQDGELLIPGDEETTVFFEKISDREDRDIISEVLKKAAEEEKKMPEEVENKEEKEEEVQKNEDSSDTIRPEVREAIDAYESFVDRYIEFMEKYENSDGDLSILLDYAKFMEELGEYTDKMDALEDDLNDAEYAYYLEVLNRCNGKMIKALN